MGNYEYEGWRNRATWNVSLWINNSESLYNAACKFMATYKGKRPYLAFIKHMELERSRTPDGILWDGKGLGLGELNEMMRELKA